jgi:hypothetical protein
VRAAAAAAAPASAARPPPPPPPPPPPAPTAPAPPPPVPATPPSTRPPPPPPSTPAPHSAAARLPPPPPLPTGLPPATTPSTRPSAAASTHASASVADRPPVATDRSNLLDEIRNAGILRRTPPPSDGADAAAAGAAGAGAARSSPPPPTLFGNVDNFINRITKILRDDEINKLKISLEYNNITDEEQQNKYIEIIDNILLYKTLDKKQLELLPIILVEVFKTDLDKFKNYEFLEDVANNYLLFFEQVKNSENWRGLIKLTGINNGLMMMMIRILMNGNI